MKILLVGDDARMRRLLSFGLATQDDQPAIVSSLNSLVKLPALNDYQVALVDWEMRTEIATDVLAQLRCLAPALPVVALTAGASRSAKALEAGATDTLVKPIDIDQARAKLADLVRSDASARFEAAPPETPVEKPQPATVAVIPTRSPLMLRQLEIAAKVASKPVSVLLLGENGTGKSHFARSIHEQSDRREKPFVTINCPCLQAHLLESELFGHVRGAFTGAVADSTGLVAAAEGGTLFLDEVGELPLSLQPKLLRLLQERCYERVGEARTRQADIRVIAATNRDLRAEVAAGRFREDLFYRLNVIALELPPLRQRSEDILPIAEHLLTEFGRASRHRFTGFSPDARLALQRHPWRGNLRELRNCIERAAVLCDRAIVGLDDLPEVSQSSTSTTPQVGDLITLAALEDAHIRCVIERTSTLTQAASLLGIDKATLYRWRRRFDEAPVPFPGDFNSAMAG